MRVAETSDCAPALVGMLQSEANPATLERVAMLIGNIAASASLRRALAGIGMVGGVLGGRARQEMQQSDAHGSGAALPGVPVVSVQPGARRQRARRARRRVVV